MHNRLTTPTFAYILSALISIGIHVAIFRNFARNQKPDRDAKIELQKGVHSVEITFTPSVASVAQKNEQKPKRQPQKLPEKIEPIKKTEPIKPPKKVVKKIEPKKVEPIEKPTEPAEEPQKTVVTEKTVENAVEKIDSKMPAKINSVEKTGSQKTQGVNAKANGEVRPIYPRRSRIRGESGTVILRAKIGANGKLLNIEIEKSSGFKSLDDSALKALKKAKFSPAIKNGKTVESEVVFPFTFALQ